MSALRAFRYPLIHWLLVFIVSGCGGATPTKAVASEPVVENEPTRTRLPGSRVSIVVPDGYHRVPHTMTYVHSESRTVVGLIELSFGSDEASNEGAKGIVDAFVERPGFISKRSVIHDGHDGTLVEVSNGRALVLVSEGEVGAVYIQYGRSERTRDTQVIINSLRFEPDVELDALAIMGVEVDEVDGLEVRNLFGGSIAFFEPGVEPPMPPGTASFTIVYHPDSTELTDHELGRIVGSAIASRNVDKGTAKLESLTIDGLQGMELTGRGQYDGTPIEVYAVALRANGGAFIMVGSVGVERAAEMLPKLRALAESFRRTGRIPTAHVSQTPASVDGVER